MSRNSVLSAEHMAIASVIQDGFNAGKFKEDTYNTGYCGACHVAHGSVQYLSHI